MNTDKIPVTVLTGYLGSGKTTLLNHLLAQPLGAGTAVIVNEFGPVSIDAQLVVGVDEEVLEINNGCICCTVRADLVATITRLLAGERPIRRILIETTGLADPAPVIQTFVLEETLAARTQLDAVVTLVDARHNTRWLRQDRGGENTAREQIAFADVLLINKTDLVSAEELAACAREIRQINPLARIHAVQHGEIAPGHVLAVGAFDLRNALALEPALLSDLTHEHADDIGSVVVRPVAPFDRDRFFGWLNRMVLARGRDLLRLKGIVALDGEARRYVFHGVHMTLDGRPGRPWAPGEVRRGEIVFIGRGLDADDLQAEVDACCAATLAVRGIAASI